MWFATCCLKYSCHSACLPSAASPTLPLGQPWSCWTSLISVQILLETWCLQQTPSEFHIQGVPLVCTHGHPTCSLCGIAKSFPSLTSFPCRINITFLAGFPWIWYPRSLSLMLIVILLRFFQIVDSSGFPGTLAVNSVAHASARSTSSQISLTGHRGPCCLPLVYIFYSAVHTSLSRFSTGNAAILHLHPHQPQSWWNLRIAHSAWCHLPTVWFNLAIPLSFLIWSVSWIIGSPPAHVGLCPSTVGPWDSAGSVSNWVALYPLPLPALIWMVCRMWQHWCCVTKPVCIT